MTLENPIFDPDGDGVPYDRLQEQGFPDPDVSIKQAHAVCPLTYKRRAITEK